ALLVAPVVVGVPRILLRGVLSSLARALETDCACRGPAQGAAISIRDGDLRVVERRRHVDDSVRHNPPFTLLLELFFALGRCSRFTRGYCIRRCVLLLFCHVSLHFV